MSEQVASQSEQSPVVEVEKDAATEALYETFGLQKQEKKDVEFPRMEEPGETVELEEEQPPAIEETKPEPKKITVKFNKEEVEIDEDKVPEYVQKGLALDKVREQAKQREAELDRAAKLLGYKDHAELTANLDNIEKQQQQKAIDHFEQTKQKIIDDLVYNGVDEATAREFAENNPLVQQAKAALDEKIHSDQQKQAVQAIQEQENQWKRLYEIFPELSETAQAFNQGGRPDWYNDEMESMIASGYKPIDAYKLAHMDKIQSQTKRATEQRLIKEQQLGVRSAAAGQSPNLESEVSLLPAQMALAEEFGVDIKGVQRQQQMIKNRR